jgi:hypothetical protein
MVTDVALPQLFSTSFEDVMEGQRKIQNGRPDALQEAGWPGVPPALSLDLLNQSINQSTGHLLDSRSSECVQRRRRLRHMLASLRDLTTEVSLTKNDSALTKKSSPAGPAHTL